MPELADVAGLYDQLVFVDAHVLQNAPDITCEPVTSAYAISAFTHHMTPEMFLCLIRALRGKKQDAQLLTIRGEDFCFCRGLSPAVKDRVAPAALKIIQLIRR